MNTVRVAVHFLKNVYQLHVRVTSIYLLLSSFLLKQCVYQQLCVPNIPCKLDYFEIVLSLCDVLRET